MKRFIFLLLGLSSTFLCVSNAHSQTSVTQAQAIFIYNFTRLIEWPSQYSRGNFTIGVYGSSSLFNDLKNYTSGKTVGDQNIAIKKISSVNDIGNMQVLFVSFGKTRDMAQILKKVGGNSTLVITEKRGGIEAGATINFILSGDKLRYEFDASNAKKVGLIFNSNLVTMSISKH